MSGESEQKLRELFEAATARAPAIIFIDEVRCASTFKHFSFFFFFPHAPFQT